MYAKVERLLSANTGSCNAYFNPKFLPKQDIRGSLLPVDIDLVNTDSIPKAHSLTLKVTDTKEVIWSEEEIEFASRQYKTRSRLSFSGQKVLLQTGTLKTVMAEVCNIYPATERDQPVAIYEDTVIHIEGLSENRQKVIDFNKIGGLDPLIRKLREIIQLPLTYPEALDKFSITPPKGLLLYGPPGNGKTMIARAIAGSLGAKFVSVEGPELSSKYVGVPEQRLREKFEEASNYKQSVIFIDEIDSIAGIRDDEKTESHQISMVSELLILMDGIRSAKGLFVIGATNRPQAVDPALRRPGRFELEYEIPFPDKQARFDILHKNIPVGDPDLTGPEITVDYLQHLSEITNGYSGADLISLYRQAVMEAIRRNMEIVPDSGLMTLSKNIHTLRLEAKDIQSVIKQITPTSLRGIDPAGKSVAWEHLIGLHDQKQELEKIHRLSGKMLNTEYHIRPSQMNLCFRGKEGSGRRTLLQAFAEKFHYELLEMDILDYLSAPFSQTLKDWERLLLKAKQVAPSIIYIKSMECLATSDRSLFITKIRSGISELGSHYPVITVLAVEKENELFESDIRGYLGFNHTVDFPDRITPEALVEISSKYELPMEKLSKWNLAELPLGVVIHEVEEMLILEI
ncbi:MULTISPECIES: AAA family ATPase [unclassified Chryseobacterium]|uniref:AAA family ATPase n=1 Tax=unclassified Chryseobacterium TaxID=2593645 RepID=UPI0013FE4D55|nr:MULTISPECIES: AAA family ATPase [unclassified Chryseobacterium]